MAIQRTKVLIPYAPREQFAPYHDSAKRFRVIVAHRRAGKTVATINELIRSVLTCTKPDPRAAFIAPLYKQAKGIAWDYARRYGLVVPGAQANEAELRIDFPNGGRLRLYGADNPDALRGIYLDDCVLDEFADMRPRFLPEVLRPALSDREGRLTLIGTPRGRNEFFDAYQNAATEAEWMRMMLRASDSGILPEHELQSARRMMSEPQYMQEYECSFDAAIEGSYYGALLAKAEQDGRIERLPLRNDLPVHTAWDLGIGDDTSIWFAQRVGAWLHIIDHYYARGEPASHYVDVLRKRAKEAGYSYAEHILPHDADSREWGNGLKRIDTLRSLELKPLRVLERTPVDDGINAVRITLPSCRFDAEKCADGLEALRQYKADYDEQRKAFRKHPLHDWTSHDADAFRYLCIGLRPEELPKKARAYQRTRPGSELSPMAA